MKIANFDEAMRILSSFAPRPTSAREVYNLDTIRALAKFMNNPQDTLRVVHVAGTSGKTSTAYYVAALLKAAGKKVGLTVSPHITNLGERVQTNLAPMAEPDFCRELGKFINIAVKSGLKPTFFELMMAFMYWEFARQNVDYAVVEVGLGGLLDGSNIVTRADKICVITDIGFDHMNVLGSTIGEIAAQKAGIILPGNEVYMHPQADEVMAVVRRTCQEKQADLYVVPEKTEADVSLLPLYQRRNITLAAAAANAALAHENAQITNENIARAARVHIPGRMEIFRVGDKTVALDGAHNAQKLQAMTKSLPAQFVGQGIAALIGFVQSKEISLRKNIDILHGATEHVVATSFGAAQEHGLPSLDAETVAQACREAGVSDVQVEPDYHEALKKLLEMPEAVLLITGSLYLVSYIRPLVAEASSKNALF